MEMNTGRFKLLNRDFVEYRSRHDARVSERVREIVVSS
jgi:hypothetical protein